MDLKELTANYLKVTSVEYVECTHEIRFSKASHLQTPTLFYYCYFVTFLVFISTKYSYRNMTDSHLVAVLLMVIQFQIEEKIGKK